MANAKKVEELKPLVDVVPLDADEAIRVPLPPGLTLELFNRAILMVSTWEDRGGDPGFLVLELANLMSAGGDDIAHGASRIP